MSRSWRTWLHEFLHPTEQGGVSFQPVEFDRLCREDPQAAHARLKMDQRELTEELERTYAAYQQRLLDLTQRIACLPPEKIEHEAAFLRECQDRLRIMLRRIEVSHKTAQELERELQEWNARDESSPPHSDHPHIRAEVIRSEMKLRRECASMEAIPPHASPFALPRIKEAQSEIPIASERGETSIEESGGLRSIDPVSLLGLIRMETREAERWHAVPQPDQDAVDQVRQLKALHAVLKQQDRERGIRRDRIAFAVRMQDVPVDESSAMWHSLDAQSSKFIRM